jgi:DNA polymerase-3 subunit gamma/tau
MAYTVLARRYRSQSFDAVVGQQPIAQTLRNAIAGGRTHHAYLFCGTRGVGKTSMARIFARALNAPDTIDDCPRPPDYDDYPPADVQQRMAEAIMRGDDLNVIEIDGASNRGVDDARQLINNASLAPTAQARYKVYIIDEVHMLTREAFNALLKTMEEPPGHLKWILCTTEPEKVPATIQSRCQRFDFRNIPTAQIAEHLKAVLQDEKVDAEDSVISQVARQGNGSMRDALSLLDRLLATGENPLTAELLEKMLGLPDRQLIADLVNAAAQADVATALQQADTLLKRGISQDQLLNALIEHLRQLMITQACGADTDLVDADEAWKQVLDEQAGQFDTPALLQMMMLCENAQRNSRASAAPRAILDAVVARLALNEQFISIASLAHGQSPAIAPQKKKR